jgi:atypical dual specificity phosphatase
MKLDFITNGIAIGNRHEAADIEILQAHGITAVLNVAYDLDLRYPSLNSSPYRFAIEYHKVGLIDGPGNEATTLTAAVYVLDQLLERHKKVFVHCHAGISRSTTVVSTYLAHKQHTNFDEALAIVQVRRPNANPNFQLRELARALPSLF